MPVGGLLVLGVATWTPLSCTRRERTAEERGASTFARACAGCHGMDGRARAAAGLAKPPRDLTDPEVQSRLDDEALRRVIREGQGAMPPFGANLSAEEVDDVIRFVRSLRR